MINPNIIDLDREMAEARDYWLSELRGASFAFAPGGGELAREAGRPIRELRTALDENTEANLRLKGRSDLGAFVLVLAAVQSVLTGYAGGAAATAIPAMPGDGDDREAERELLYIFHTPDISDDYRKMAAVMKEKLESALRYQYYPPSALLNDEERRALSTIVLFAPGLHGDYSAAAHLRRFPSAIVLEWRHAEAGAAIVLRYAEGSHDDELMTRLLRNIAHALSDGLDDPSLPIARLRVSPQEFDWLMRVSNPAPGPLESRRMIDLFFERAEENPQHPAVIWRDEQLSYGELAVQVRLVAERLRRMGIGRGSLVALTADRSIPSIVMIMGTLATDAAFLPLNGGLPPQTVAGILEESRPDLLVLRGDLVNVGTTAVRQMKIEELLADDFTPPPAAPTAGEGRSDRPEDLAYIIYTSGTTGRPKGVMIAQKSIADRVSWRAEEYAMSADERVLLLPPLYFDGYQTTFFAPIVSGGTVVQATDEEARDPHAVARLIRDHDITHLFCIPSLFTHLLELFAESPPESLRTVALGGEKITQSIIDKMEALAAGWELINEYGPTEGTVVATIRRQVRDNLSIGKPIRNTEIHILDESGHLLPTGAIGEIHIGGPGLALGYIGNPALTDARFIPHPFTPGAKLYRTGDLGRWTSGGEIEYFGRMDRQVKVSGYRIELDAIERCLAALPSVGNAAAVAVSDRETERKALVAYYEASEDVTPSAIREGLAQVLPAYMIPHRIVRLEKLPITSRGKIDYDKLASLQTEAKHRHVPDIPLTDTQRKLSEIWSRLLRLEHVPPAASFFELGGNSITASLMLQQVRAAGYAPPSYQEFYDNPTLIGLSALLDATRSAEAEEPIPALPEDGEYATSSAQKRMYMLEMFGDVRTSYNMPGAVLLEGELDPDRLTRALRKVVDANEALRTSFHLRDGVPVQRVNRNVCPEIEWEDAEAMDLDSRMRAFVRPFELDRAPLLRLRFVRLGPDRHLLLWDMHHIISDAVTIDLLLRQWLTLYQDEQAEIRPPEVEYKDYAAWHNERLGSGRLADRLRYWQDLFADGVPVLEFPRESGRPPTREPDGRRISWEIDKPLMEQIRAFTSATRTTTFMFLMSVYQIVLAKVSGQADIVVGTPVSVRDRNDLQRTMGVFVNTLPVRSKPEGGRRYLDYLEEIRTRTLSMFEHRDVPLEAILDGLSGETPDRKPQALFQTMFSYQDFDVRPVTIGGMKMTPLEHGYVAPKFDFALEAYETGEGLRMQFDFNAARFDAPHAEAFVRRYRLLVEHIVRTGGEALIRELPILSAEEHERIVHAFNRTGREFPLELAVHQLFERQAEATPESVALKHGEAVMTYAELNGHANRLASLLRGLGCGPNEPVAICAEHGFGLIIGILGILKSGAAFLPLDPAQNRRLEYMLEDSGTRILLTDRPQDFARLSERVRIIGLDGAEFARESAANLPPVHNADDLAYIIYTSGTTGEPKGVMIPHRGLTNYICWADSVYVGGEALDFACYSSIAFDLTITSLFTPLIAGNRILLYSGANKAQLVRDIFRDNPRCVVKLTPSHLKLIEDMDLSGTNIAKLIVGGEDLKNGLAARIVRASRGKIRIFNEYGPTETVVGCMIREYSPGDAEGSVPIGRPADNMRVYLLDRDLNPVPDHAVGELYVSGVGVAKGYLNKPGLMREKFMPDPFAPGLTMYRTGDIGFRNGDGELVYLGRADDQIKIRGYRIEPGEVEKVLLTSPDIRDVVVVDGKHRSGETVLVAYYISDRDDCADELRRLAREHLPDYMAPGRYIRVESFPLSVNGKVDRKALRALPLEDQARLPVGEVGGTEGRVLSIWREILQTDAFDLDTSFFDAGGSSILALKLYDRLEKEYPGCLSVTDIFAYPTIRTQAGKIDSDLNAARGEALPALRLPESFYTGRDSGRMERTRVLKLEGEEREKFRESCARYEATAGELLSAAYIYTLAAVSGQTAIPVLAGAGREARLLEFDLDACADFGELLNLVRGALAEGPGGEPARDLASRLVGQSPRDICPMIELRPGGRPDPALAKRSDLLMAYALSDHSLTLEFTYNSHKLSENVELFFGAFADNLEVIMD